MKCDACLSLIEEFFDDELEEAKAQSVGAHIARCAACREVLDQLEAENEFYITAQSSLEIRPAIWAGIESRIHGDTMAQGAKSSRWAVIFSRWTAINWPGPALAGTAVLMLLLLSGAGALLLWDDGRHEPLVVQGNNAQAPPVTPASQTTSNVTGANPAIEGVSGSSTSTTETKALGITASTARIPVHSQRENRTMRAAGLHSARVTTPPVTADDKEITIDPARLEAAEQETVRHIEQVQNLLRSFRNSKMVGNAAELRYERKRSRDLLGQNIFLRRNAEDSGNVSTAELLSMLEPYLLDIANLAEKPTYDDVRTIKNRIQKEEVVAALQVP
jgi:hypothetical protein